MKNYTTIKRNLLKDKAVREAYEDIRQEFALAQVIIQKRIERGLTQSELARKMKTKQSAIARLESGAYNPSLAFLEKAAKALDTRVSFYFSDK